MSLWATVTVAAITTAVAITVATIKTTSETSPDGCTTRSKSFYRVGTAKSTVTASYTLAASICLSALIGSKILGLNRCVVHCDGRTGCREQDSKTRRAKASNRNKKSQIQSNRPEDSRAWEPLYNNQSKPEPSVRKEGIVKRKAGSTALPILG